MSKSKETIVFSHQNMNIKYLKTKKGLWQLSFDSGEGYKDGVEPVPFPNFQLAVAGIPYGSFPALVAGYTYLPVEMIMEKVERSNIGIIFTYKHEKLGLKVIVDMNLIAGVNVIRQFVTVINEGNEPVVITHLSSMCMNGIATGGIKPWNDTNKIRVHYCIQSWQGEGQWRSAELEELGLYSNSVHPCFTAIHFSSVGSWSTGRYLPMAVIEDLETNNVWYWQIETSTNWHFEIGHRGSGEDGKGLFIHADGADERFGGWSKKLMPNEKFTSVPAAVGCCTGNFNDAIRELSKYRRTFLKPGNHKMYCPVVFNDYMNTLWGDPTIEKLLPLIDAASEAGAEYYCMDAGWQVSMNVSWGKGLGDWQPSTDRFGKKGLKGVMDYIRSKGMVPGLWVELEVCGQDSELGKKSDAWFLMRNGGRIGQGDRWFLNMTNLEVRTYLRDVVNRLVGMGVGYLKNDYNACIGNGCDIAGCVPADGLIGHTRALYEFIDEVRTNHPHLILENVGSGGMRQDYGILSRFHIQSITDQEIYYNYPSILGGSLACVLPEQMGVWVYPYPLSYREMHNPGVLTTEEYKKSMADGEQTIFNMINGLCGNICLSGCLNAADELNMNLVKEAIVLYKKERVHINKSYPFWPIGFTRINNKNSWAAVGLANEENTRLLLAVWRLGSMEKYVELPLYGWTGRYASVVQLYPSRNYDVNFYYNKSKGALTVHLPKMYQARYFEIIKI